MGEPDKTSIPETPVNKDRNRNQDLYKPTDFEEFTSAFEFKDFQQQWARSIGIHEDIVDKSGQVTDRDIWNIDCFQSFLKGWTEGEKMLKILLKTQFEKEWKEYAEGLEEIYIEMRNIEFKFGKWLKRKLANEESRVSKEIQLVLNNRDDYTYEYDELNKFEKLMPEPKMDEDNPENPSRLDEEEDGAEIYIDYPYRRKRIGTFDALKSDTQINSESDIDEFTTAKETELKNFRKWGGRTRRKDHQKWTSP